MSACSDLWRRSCGSCNQRLKAALEPRYSTPVRRIGPTYLSGREGERERGREGEREGERDAAGQTHPMVVTVIIAQYSAVTYLPALARSHKGTLVKEDTDKRGCQCWSKAALVKGALVNGAPVKEAAGQRWRWSKKPLVRGGAGQKGYWSKGARRISVGSLGMSGR
jgi:hypothetical protein